MSDEKGGLKGHMSLLVRKIISSTAFTFMGQVDRMRSKMEQLPFVPLHVHAGIQSDPLVNTLLVNVLFAGHLMTDSLFRFNCKVSKSSLNQVTNAIHLPCSENGHITLRVGKCTV